MSGTEQRLPGKLLAAVVWRRRDQLSIEHCRVVQGPDVITIDGSVVAALDEASFRADYLIRCDGSWRTRSVQVRVVHGAVTRRLDLEHPATGPWLRNGDPVAGSDGLLDIDLSITPSTNTLPIRRLDLAVGGRKSVEALWIRFPDLQIDQLSQTYQRSGPGAYRYESNGGAFAAELEVDSEGVVVTYGDLWERVSST